ncbi:MAG TPA: hypothetical protein VID29_01305 [Solirubrobacteraceae bacterium]|jgi:hypothetical protein
MSDTTDVTSTLAELERKLRELEQELTSIGRRRARTAVDAATEPSAQAVVEPALEAPIQPTGRLIDEEVEYEPIERPAPSERSAPVERPARSERSAPIEQPTPSERPGPTDAQLASLADLRRFRDRLERFAKELTDEYDALLGRVMSSFSARGPEAETRGFEPSPSMGFEPDQSVSAAARAAVLQAPPTPPTPPAPPPPPARPTPPHQETLFEGRVELGVGPFYDIGSLGSFEQRLAELPYVLEVSVRRFEASHAVIDLRLAEPVPLVRELRRVLETDFGVRQVAGGRILLTFDDA